MNTHPQIILEFGEYRQQSVIFIRFAYNPDIIKRLKETSPARWSQTKACWYILKSDFHLDKFYQALKEFALIDYSSLKVSVKSIIPDRVKRDYSYRSNITLPIGYLELLKQKRYSESTVKTYSAYYWECLI